jgi:hypothetical protein
MTRILPDLTQPQIETDEPRRPEGDVEGCERLLTLLYRYHPERIPKEEQSNDRPAY